MAIPQTTRTADLDQQITALTHANRLRSWSSFVEDLQVPPDLYLALQPMRPELIRQTPTRTLSADETATLYRLIAGLIETNVALQQHAQEVAKLVGHWTGAFKQLQTTGLRIEDFAQFRTEIEDY